jgi:hypothetical protein
MDQSNVERRIQSWEVMLGEAIGEDAAIRVLCHAAKRPLTWLSSQHRTNPPATKQSDGDFAKDS